MNQEYQVLIIGAGAAGLMCAITAAKRGRRVILVDHANKVGKKILMSGGGRCNFTNYSIEPENYLCSNPHFCISALSRYTQWQFIELVESYHIEYYDKGLGQLFCKHRSKEIRDMLVSECDKHSVSIQLETQVQSIHRVASGRFTVSTSTATSTGQYSVDSIVIATGGLSIPSMGATAFGYDIAKQFGHTVFSIRPSLTPLTFDKKWLSKTAFLPGNSLMVEATCNGQSFRESMLFTHKGLSGPVILQISNYWQPGDRISINLLPDIPISDWLTDNKSKRPDINLKTLLSTVFSQSIAEYLCGQLDQHDKLKHLEKSDIQKISSFLTNWGLYPSGYEGYKVAEVTKGGINTDEISSKTLESKREKGLYFIGEVLDVTGHLGGYNFQWAWASGHAAGSFV